MTLLSYFAWYCRLLALAGVYQLLIIIISFNKGVQPYGRMGPEVMSGRKRSAPSDHHRGPPSAGHHAGHAIAATKRCNIFIV